MIKDNEENESISSKIKLKGRKPLLLTVDAEPSCFEVSVILRKSCV